MWCVHEYVRVYVYLHLHVLVCECVCIYAFVWVCTRTFVGIGVCICKCMCACVCVCTCTCTICVSVYTYVCMIGSFNIIYISEESSACLDWHSGGTKKKTAASWTSRRIFHLELGYGRRVSTGILLWPSERHGVVVIGVVERLVVFRVGFATTRVLIGLTRHGVGFFLRACF